MGAPLLDAADTGLFPYTPPTNLLYGLRESLAMFGEEGLPAVFARHRRHAEATRRAVRAWGLEAWTKEYTVYIPHPDSIAAWVILPPPPPA